MDEGRKQLHLLARRFGAFKKPSATPFERAIEVGPHRRGGLVLVPAVDVEDVERRLEEGEREKEELLDELEAIGLALLAQERLANPTPVDELIPLEELARRHGFGDLLEA